MSMPQSYDVSLLDEERYRLLVDAITDYAIYMLDADGHVVSWNPGAQRFKGYEAWEILGEHFSRFYTNEDRLARLPSAQSLRPRAKADRRWKAGACARTAPVFGRMSSSTRSGIVSAV